MSSPAIHLASTPQIPRRTSENPPRPLLRSFPRGEEFPSKTLVRAVHLHKSYRKGKVEVPVLCGVDFAAEEGEITSIIGQSGSGKSTLLHLLATLDHPDQGEVYFGDQRIDDLPGRERDLFRNRMIGMIFQFYHLLPELSTLENVLAPCMIHASLWSYFRHGSTWTRKAMEMLDWVGLAHRAKHRPSELSGGEMQRAAIARALITEPRLLLADEPTGNLDQESGESILELLRRLHREAGLTIVMVTHDEKVAMQSDRVVRLVRGQVETLEKKKC